MAKKEISWILRAKDSVTTVLNRVGKSFKSFASAGIGAAKMIGAAFLAIGAAAGAIGARFVSAYQKAAQSSAKLESVLKATGHAAGFTTSQLQDQAAELQKQTGIDGDLILSMQGVLASFRNISGENFQEATKAIMDMSTVLKKAGQDEADIEQASMQVGKALNDPAKGMKALSKIGVTFNEVQKEQIAKMQQAGDLAGAQKIILEELKNEFGGAAEGIDSNVKAYKVFMAALGDTEEEIGRVITENAALSSIFDILTKKLEELSESGLIDYWAENMVSAIKMVMDWLSPLWNKLKKLVELYKMAQEGWKAIGEIAGGMWAGQSFEEAVNDAVKNTSDLEEQKQTRLTAIRKERAERKAAAAEREQQEMKAGQARRKTQDEADAKLKSEMEISKITDDLEYRIRLQELLNKGLKTEAELMKVQKDLGRELTDEEKARVSEKLDALQAAEDEGNIKYTTPESPKIDLERLGAIFTAPPSGDGDKRELRNIVSNTKKTNEILQRLYDKSSDEALENA